jgi:hypothetical protein
MAQTIVVTGASKGIGHEAAPLLEADVRKVSGDNVLAVASVIGLADQFGLEHADEPFWVAPMLRRGLAGRTGCIEIRSVDAFKETKEIFVDIRTKAAACFHLGVGGARPARRRDCLARRGKSNVAARTQHGQGLREIGGADRACCAMGEESGEAA